MQKECMICLPIDCCDEMFYCCTVGICAWELGICQRDAICTMMPWVSLLLACRKRKNGILMSKRVHVELSLPVFMPSKNFCAKPNWGSWISRPLNPQALIAWTQKKSRVGPSVGFKLFGMKTVAGRHQYLAIFSTSTTSGKGNYS